MSKGLLKRLNNRLKSDGEFISFYGGLVTYTLTSRATVPEIEELIAAKKSVGRHNVHASADKVIHGETIYYTVRIYGAWAYGWLS